MRGVHVRAHAQVKGSMTPCAEAVSKMPVSVQGVIESK